MNFASFFPYDGHRHLGLPAVLAALLLLVLVCMVAKPARRWVHLLIGVGLLAGAYWWFGQIRN